MLTDDVRQAITDAVDRNFDKQVRFTQDMVRCPSTRGNEHTVQDLMASAMAERRLTVDHWKVKVEDIKDMRGFAPVVDATYENAWNVVGTYRRMRRRAARSSSTAISSWSRPATPAAGPRRPSSSGSTMAGCMAGAPET